MGVPGSTAGGQRGRWPTARRGCSWPMSARWDGHWWTRGCICPRVGPLDKDRCEAAGVPLDSRATGPRRSWPWRLVGRCTRSGARLGRMGLRTTPSGYAVLVREGLAATPGCGTGWNVPSGFTVWPPEPAWKAEYQGGVVPANPGCETVRRTWSSAATSSGGGLASWITVALPREARGHAATFSAPRGSNRPAGASPAKSTNGRPTGLNIRQEPRYYLSNGSGGYPVGDPGIRGRPLPPFLPCVRKVGR